MFNKVICQCSFSYSTLYTVNSIHSLTKIIGAFELHTDASSYVYIVNAIIGAHMVV